MARIVVFAALGWECQPALRALRGVRREARRDLHAWRGRAGRDEVLVVKTGMGPQRAAAAAATVDLTGCMQVISTGCAGGLAADLQVGDLVVASAVHGDDGVRDTDATLRARVLARAAEHGLHIRIGAIRCSATVLGSPAAKRAAAAAGPIAVEMEGTPLVAAAAAAAVPFLSVRAVLDTADDDLAVLGHISDPTSGRVRPLRLLSHLVGHPQALAQLRTLQRAKRLADDRLSAFFAAWLRQP
ncbi:MAG: hypothetical protein SF182_10670 [Deltaproteobacteria bacterium]|nr:hypothetical protein [Deltaproteobacteria bacterium]